MQKILKIVGKIRPKADARRSSKTDLKFRGFMIDLANEFKSDDLSHFKYALKDVIPSGRSEKLRTALDVLIELEDRGIIGRGKLHELRRILEIIQRPCMVSLVDDFSDSTSSFPLKSTEANYLEMGGYRVTIKGGRHFDTTEGQYVEVRSGANYALTLTNLNNHRCLWKLKIDGYELFSKGFLLYPRGKVTIERPSRVKKKFKFYAISDAPTGAGINKYRKDKNGYIKIVVTPEKADMKVTCIASGATTEVLSCSDETTDSEFYRMVLSTFGATSATIMIKCKPLSKRDIKLSEYGIQDGSRIDVNLGGKGGKIIENMAVLKGNKKWRAGATALEDESQQEFVDCRGFPQDPIRATSLNLRLVAREDEQPLPSTGKSTPLVNATLIPPPVPT